jgi:cyclic pyranopterin phosphate synthase
MAKAKRREIAVDPPPLTHFNEQGAARMVDVSGKPVSRRQAEASGQIRMSSATRRIIWEGTAAKGDVLQVARLAGVQAAKQTPHLIPLCHTIPLSQVEIDFALAGEDLLIIRATVSANHQTGVEMEALTSVAVAALTVYDMCKSVDRSMVIERIQLEAKSGGTRGDYRRASKRKSR